MQNDVLIRKLTREDKNAYMHIFSDVLNHDFPEYSQRTRDFVISKQTKDFLEEVKLPYKIVLGAFIDSKLVALANGMHLDQGVGNCSWLMVDRTHQKKGIGKKLVTAMEEEMKKIGDHSVNIYASEWNIPFYKKLGYELVGLYKKAWFGADYYLFVKTIQEPKEENFLR
jgi:GNAT superfamily N-acetyltransferase